MNVLSLNLGSSSLKFAVHAFSGGTFERVMDRDLTTSAQPQAASEAARQAIAVAVAAVGRMDAVGHRIVFGGDDDAPQAVTEELIHRLESLQPLDPLHAPGALAVLQEARCALSNALHVACFDTTFFQDLPKTGRVLPIPCGDLLLRRYGFHGLSYEYVARTLGESLKTRTIFAHLGNGASLAALLDGKPIASTMAFSPLSGVVMSTRPGDLDPGVLLYLLECNKLSVPRLRDMLENESGLRALSGGEPDIQKLCERSDAGAAFAVEMFVQSVSKAIGAFAVQLGGIDMLVFTGGVGTHNVQVRTHILERVTFLNRALAVQVIPTDENLMIAHHTSRVASTQSVRAR
jgi:acetate kinase